MLLLLVLFGVAGVILLVLVVCVCVCVCDALVSFLQRIANQIFGLVGKFVDDFIGCILVFQKVWSHYFLIDDGSSVVRDWQHAPDEQHTL